MTIEEQIKLQMKKAFFDLIYENVNSESPDFDWIVNLYSEIRDRLSPLVNKEGKSYIQIKESFDVELFRQMIENDAFDAESMSKLVNNVFHWIFLLQAPYRDDDTKNSLSLVLETPSDKIISVFLQELHKCIDNIYEDLEKLKQKS